MQEEPDTIQQLVEPVVNGLGYELWGCDLRIGAGSALLRVYIDSASGISLDDCALVSHQLSGLLDVEEPIKMPYTLEVSSPGMDRPLLKRDHYLSSRGQKVKIKLKWPIDSRRNFAGELTGVEGDQLILSCEEGSITLPLNAVKQARIAPFEL